MNGKFLKYAEIALFIAKIVGDGRYSTDIKSSAIAHYPRNLRQYASDNILLEVVKIEYGYQGGEP